AWQWAIGLEWFLLARDPWRIVLSTDHPNGASFVAYPQIIRLLMDRAYRREMLERVHPVVAKRSHLRDLEREYTLAEIATITRAAPARILGLSHKGHLGPGADADVTIYAPHKNVAEMFALPKYVIKSGQVLVDNGEPRAGPVGTTLFVRPAFDRDTEPSIADWFARNSSVQFRNFPLTDTDRRFDEEIACASRT
ncbi:MAG TPA: amidohydrolase family protein, partial [Pirellulaceae bacterium]